MSWESVIGGALQGISNFAGSLVSILTGSLSAATIEGIIGLLFIGVIIRLVDGAPKIPGKILEKISENRKRRDDDDDDYEYIRVRRQRK